MYELVFKICVAKLAIPVNFTSKISLVSMTTLNNHQIRIHIKPLGACYACFQSPIYLCKHAEEQCDPVLAKNSTLFCFITVHHPKPAKFSVNYLLYNLCSFCSHTFDYPHQNNNLPYFCALKQQTQFVFG